MSPRTLAKDNALWEYLVNNYSDKELITTLKSMTLTEVSAFLVDCDKLGSDIIQGKNLMFEKAAVSIIIQVRKAAAKIGNKKLKGLLQK